MSRRAAPRDGSWGAGAAGPRLGNGRPGGRAAVPRPPSGILPPWRGPVPDPAAPARPRRPVRETGGRAACGLVRG